MKKRKKKKKREKTIENNGIQLHRGSYMSTHVLLNLLNEFGKKSRREAMSSIFSVSSTSLINSTIQEYERKILFII